MKKFFLIILLLLFVDSHQAQTDTCSSALQGKVIDEHDGIALEFASVFVMELNLGVITDANGHYEFNNICNGNYHIKISHLGCKTVTSLVNVKGQTWQNFYPEHHAEMLKDVNVFAQKTEVIPTQIKNEIPIEKLNQSKGLSLGEALKNISGVTSLNTGNSISKPIIHGLHSNRILILNNGIRQEGQQWGVEHAPEIDPFIANSITVIKGANSVKYGSDAIAGVVLINTKPMMDTAGLNGEINLIGMTNGRAGTASAFLEGKFEKIKNFSWRAQGTLKQSGNVNSPKYILVNTGLKENNFSYELEWKKHNYGFNLFYSQFNNTLGIFGATHIGNLSDLQTAFNSPVPLETGGFTYKIGRPYQHIEHELVKFKSYVKTGGIGKLQFIYARQYNLRYEYDKFRPLSDSLADLNKPELQFELTTHTADLIWEHNRIKKLHGSIGMNGLSQGNTYQGRMLVPNYSNYSGGVFWIERWKNNNFELESGLRYDYKRLQTFMYQAIANNSFSLSKPIHQFQNLSFNIGSIYKMDTTLNLSFNFGSAWRAPSINELYANGLHQGAASLEYGNTHLQMEKAYTSIFAIKYQSKGHLFFELSPYYNFITNYIYRQPQPTPVLTIRGAFPAFDYKQTDAIISGCDIYISYKFFKSLEISEKASILRARNIKTNNWLILMPSDRYETELIYRFKKKNKINSAYVSSSFLFVTKQWRVPVNSDFVVPPSEYYIFNAHAACTLIIKRQLLEIGLSVTNVFNSTYRDYLDRFRYFTDAIGRNISLRIKVPIGISKKSQKN